MKEQKIKRYRLSISETFPITHPRKGEETNFVENAIVGIWSDGRISPEEIRKLHTIRGNYQLWEKRMAEIQAGRAVIEMFYWSGKQYGKGVKQLVFATLDKDSGCGVQMLDWHEMIQVMSERAFVQNERIYTPLIEKGSPTIESLSNNDGLSLQDFKDWFKGYDLSKPMAIIHFTKFRY